MIEEAFNKNKCLLYNKMGLELKKNLAKYLIWCIYTLCEVETWTLRKEAQRKLEDLKY